MMTLHYFLVSILILSSMSTSFSYVQGPPGIPDIFRTTSADGKTKCTKCEWTSPNGATFDLSELCEHHYTVTMDQPRGSQISFGICDTVECGEAKDAMACVYVPGNPPTSSGRALSIEQIQPFVPSKGVKLVLENGEMCSVINKPRRTIIELKCDQSPHKIGHIQKPSKAWEGEASDVCIYHVAYTTTYSCPQPGNKYTKPTPTITAVSGCIDSIPIQTTSECSATDSTTLTIHGLDFPVTLGQAIEATVGGHQCSQAKMVNQWTVVCQLPPGEGKELDVKLAFVSAQGQRESSGYTMAKVSYKSPVDYRQEFTHFLELGVGGLSKQIAELYQRAFATRGIPSSLLAQLGISHARGILLHGPPGSGKTLLARTIAKILHTQQVRLINAPEIMSKYLGESEQNLRGHFQEAEKAWHEHGEASDLHVIIIDEIDAICKQRGRAADASAAGLAYDSVVNQLLTLMDGLKEIPNVLVIGMTNRKELMDPALLRPGRFEVHIEIGMPDLEGRWEIFTIHTREMEKHQMLSADVDLWELATNTSHFSGAEIAGVVRLATSYAIDRKYGSGVNGDVPMIVTRSDFQRALLSTDPAHTEKNTDLVQTFLPHGLVNCSVEHNAIQDKLLMTSAYLQSSTHGYIETVLMFGPRGTGKSALAANLAVNSDFTYVKVISPHTFANKLANKMDILTQAFHDAAESQYSLVILDSLHLFLEVVKAGSDVRLSQELLSKLASLLATPVKNKVIVVASVFSGSKDLEHWPAGQIGLQEMFRTRYFVPLLDSSAVHNTLLAMNITNTNGAPLVIPAGLMISFQDLFRVTDCFSFEQEKNDSSLPQFIFEKCFKQLTGKPITASIVQ